MAHAKVKLIPRKQALVDKGRTLKGKTLRVAVSIESRMAESILKAIDRMTRETEREIRKLFEADNYAGDYGMDANIGAQARILMNGLNVQFDQMFARVATPITETMLDQVDKNSAATLKSSLLDMAGTMTFKTDIMTGPLQEMIAASAAESVALIKRVPAKYLDQITGNVMRAITQGNGLQDIVPMLEKQKVQVRNWAQNVAMDQTRKVYNGLNAGRMQALGIEKYRWVHSGGSNQPRDYHQHVLNGQIFSLDKDPVIQLKPRVRGKPGFLPYCRCTMCPVVEIDGKIV